MKSTEELLIEGVCRFCTNMRNEKKMWEIVSNLMSDFILTITLLIMLYNLLELHNPDPNPDPNPIPFNDNSHTPNLS